MRRAFVGGLHAVLLVVACVLAAAQQHNGPTPFPTLTKADQVRHLTAEQALQGYPVRIRGVITDDVPAPDFFVQDQTAGVYVEGSKTSRFSHVLGDIVEIQGVTGPGKFAPVIRETSTRFLGKGTLPPARLYSFHELASGELDSQRVQIRGIVRSAAVDRTSWHEVTLAMNIASGGGHFNLRVPIDGSRETDVSSWVDSEVLIEGVCGSLFNTERQLVGILFYVPRLSFIKIEAPAKEVPFTELLRFSPDQRAGHRVRVRGVVAYQEPGRAVFLERAGKGLRILTQQSTPLAIGDMIEVLGFPAVGESGPVLEDSLFRKVGHEAAPASLKLDLATPWEKYDGALVNTEAKLVGREQFADGTISLLLQIPDGPLFNASFRNTDAAHRLMNLPINSDLRVNGICLVRSGGLWEVPESFRILLRSPEDLSVLRAPSWWNMRHTLGLLGMMAATLLILVLWVVALGRRLRNQMSVVRQKLRSGAVLEERNRIARELHDTLEQELAGITMQLDLAVDCFRHAPNVARHALETARNMTRHSMREARRSVWDLRCHLLENGDLVSALKQSIAPLSAGNHVNIQMEVRGTLIRLPVQMELNLLRIGQEGATNAVKHAHANNIKIDLQFDPDRIRLRISDDGRGFLLEDAALSSNGHFGLLDMRERAQSLGSDLQVQSEPGRGTRIEVEIAADGNETRSGHVKAHSYSGSR